MNQTVAGIMLLTAVAVIVVGWLNRDRGESAEGSDAPGATGDGGILPEYFRKAPPDLHKTPFGTEDRTRSLAECTECGGKVAGLELFRMTATAYEFRRPSLETALDRPESFAAWVGGHPEAGEAEADCVKGDLWRCAGCGVGWLQIYRERTALGGLVADDQGLDRIELAPEFVVKFLESRG